MKWSRPVRTPRTRGIDVVGRDLTCVVDSVDEARDIALDRQRRRDATTALILYRYSLAGS
jgi:hypothetical protein